MRKLSFTITLIIAAGLIFTAPALAATCTLDIAQMYDRASSKGWTFKCLKGVLHFDNQKRPGCSSKPIVPTAWEEARFLSNTAFRDKSKTGKMRNGWRVKSYQISGGQWSKKSSGKGATSSRINFTFSTKAGSYHRRYLSKIRLEKSYGDCARVYDEAF